MARLGEIEELVEKLEMGEAQRGPQPSLVPRNVTLNQMPRDDWNRLISEIQHAIRSRQFEKLVAARECVCESDLPFDPLDAALRLADEPGCTRFLLGTGGTRFLGATPERLFRKLDRTLITAAVAGTIRSTGSEFPAQSRQSVRLMESSKNREEHAYVVRAIADALSPFAETIERFDSPTVIRIRSIIHLNTAITATLKASVNPVDLLHAIHPSPAVGGLPQRGAAEWIRAHEPVGRGWYTGPVGWIDPNGDAEFVVAIRAGLLSGSRAFVYSGAGIVLDSEAEAEYAETELKQQPLLRALGVIPS